MQNISGRLLNGQKTNLHEMMRQNAGAHLIMYKFKAHAETHLASFREPFLKFYATNPDIKLIDV